MFQFNLKKIKKITEAHFLLKKKNLFKMGHTKIWLKAVVSGIVLVVLDVFIEPVAINWNMWTWKTSSVPIQNYITWGLTAIVFSLILSKQINATNSNKMAPVVLILQFVFFLILGLCG